MAQDTQTEIESTIGASSAESAVLTDGLDVDYKNTQPYKLGLIYKELGEMLMNPKTDIQELVRFSRGLGCKVSISLGE